MGICTLLHDHWFPLRQAFTTQILSKDYVKPTNGEREGGSGQAAECVTVSQSVPSLSIFSEEGGEKLFRQNSSQRSFLLTLQSSLAPPSPLSSPEQLRELVITGVASSSEIYLMCLSFSSNTFWYLEFLIDLNEYDTRFALEEE